MTMMAVMMWTFKLVGVFLLWTFIIYWMHRLAHVRAPFNPLYRIHQGHHQQKYDGTRQGFKIEYLWWNFGELRLAVDIIITQTIPLLILTWFFPSQGLVLLVFHYLYEVFLSEDYLDHNIHIQGDVTRFFAWGRFHMTHHHKPKYNYCLMVTLWDFLFRTAEWKPLRELNGTKPDKTAST